MMFPPLITCPGHKRTCEALVDGKARVLCGSCMNRKRREEAEAKKR